MNWQLSALDPYFLISNSDAHSPAKLGREGNLLEGECSYLALKEALTTGKGLLGTIEFFPEEGKYHYDGHLHNTLLWYQNQKMLQIKKSVVSRYGQEYK